MSVSNVSCTANKLAIDANAPHTNGTKVPFTIDPGRALVDSNGTIRFFTIVYPDGDVQSYLLHPYQTDDNNLKEVSWIASFLGNYGLSRTRGNLVRNVTRGMSTAAAEVVQLGAFFLFTLGGAQIIQSFAQHILSPNTKLGYHNVLTDQLIFPTVLTVSRW